MGEGEIEEMRYDISLRGDTFSPAANDFDLELAVLLSRMRNLNIEEGTITLKLNIELERQFPVDEDGNQREIYVPQFEHEVTTALTQKTKRTGEIDHDFVLTMSPDGIVGLYSRDTENLFDMVNRMGGDEDDEGGD